MSIKLCGWIPILSALSANRKSSEQGKGRISFHVYCLWTMSSVAWYMICKEVCWYVKAQAVFILAKSHQPSRFESFSTSIQTTFLLNCINNAWAYSDETFKIQLFLEFYLQPCLKVPQTLQITVYNFSPDTFPPFTTHTQKNTAGQAVVFSGGFWNGG